jgi:hypothetical protein
MICVCADLSTVSRLLSDAVHNNRQLVFLSCFGIYLSAPLSCRGGKRQGVFRRDLTTNPEYSQQRRIRTFTVLVRREWRSMALKARPARCLALVRR